MAKSKAVTDDFEDFDDLEEEEETVAKKSSKSASKSKASAKKDKPAGLSATQVAEKLDADPKTFRAWLRTQVKNGDVELPHREGRERYVLGANWKDDTVVAIMELWKESDHRKGAKKKSETDDAPKPKAKAKPKSKKG